MRLDKQGIFGLTLLFAGIYLLCSSIVIVPGCDWSELKVCQTANSEVNNTESVKLELCQAGFLREHMSSYSQIGLATNPEISNDCRRFDCGGCLKITTPCESKNARPQYECVGNSYTADAPPLAIFIYLIFIFAGLAFFLMPWTLLDSKVAIFAAALFFFGHYWLARSVYIVESCPNSEATYDRCSSGSNGDVRNSHVVILTQCSKGVYRSPFSTNLIPENKCLQYGCSAKSCLKETYPCPFNPKGAKYECVHTQAIGAAAPVNVFVSALFIVVGGVIWAFSRRHERREGYQSVP